MKTAMLVSVTACLGQLKWRHFSTRPRAMYDLSLLDDSSRGPWGSFMLLTTWRIRSVLVLGLALLSILALGIEPSTQQIISVGTRDRKIPSDSVLTSRADGYFSIRSMSDHQISEATIAQLFPGKQAYELELMKAFRSVLAGSVRTPFYSCSDTASRCEWDDFSTLAVCSDLHNVTYSVPYDCDIRHDLPNTTDFALANCTYEFPTGLPSTENAANRISLTLIYGIPDVMRQAFTLQSSIINSTASIASFWIVGNKDRSQEFMPWPNAGDFHSPAFRQAFSDYVHSFDSYIVDFYWCNRTYHNMVASSGKRTADIVSSLAWKACDCPYLKAKYHEPSCCNWSNGPNATGILPNTSYPISHLYSSSASGKTYNISQYVFRSMGSFLQDQQEELIAWLATAGIDMETNASDMAAALTEYMLRPGGDNVNTTTLSGYEVFTESYYRVDWAWLALPALEVLLASILLVATIIMTRHQPALKNSAIALLIHGLSGWADDELQISEPETAQKLQSFACSQMTLFARDEQGNLKFQKSGETKSTGIDSTKWSNWTFRRPPKMAPT
ncbi:hypothetical protein ONZ43_g3583 [Nemania bipapillata]|uniref:Uncharacterized protein n=1 Tax=Nemania bipapillata TaxID=110536 RepID=A0ACC2IWJ3_9PEZI|nr:hypothetical protein ONZ43_g3583 [Nemania bipapillata]